jgi:hypothetical protein
MVGKPKGSPKSGGRVKGTTNKLTTDYKDLIAQSDPIQFLIDAFTQGYINGNVEDAESAEQYLTLTLKERCDIAKDLAKKIVPDVKAIEHTGVGELQTIIYVNSAIPAAPNQKNNDNTNS